MSSQEESKDFSVSKVAPYESEDSKNMKNSMAVLKYNVDWQNVISQFRGGMEVLFSTEVKIKKGLIELEKVPEHLKDKVRLDPTDLYNIKKVWNGRCYVTRERHHIFHNSFIPNSELFHFDESKINFNNPHLTVIPLPAMDNMTPIGRLRDPTLLIQISEAIPNYLAFEGMDYDTLIREGGLYHMQGERMIAKITPEEMNSKIKKTMKVGRDYYHKTMNILKYQFLQCWRPLAVDIHQIILFCEQQELNINEFMKLETRIEEAIDDSDIETENEELYD